MKKTRFVSGACVFVLLVCSTQITQATDPVSLGIGAVKGGIAIGQFLWNSQDLSVLQNISLVQIHEKLTGIEKLLESVASETVYKGEFQKILSEMSTNSIKIDTIFNTTVHYLKFNKAKVHEQEKKKIIDFANIIFKPDDDLPFGRYSTLYIDVTTKLTPVLKKLNNLLQRDFKFTCSKFEHQLESFQQSLLMLLKTVKVAEIKVFLIVKASARLLRTYEGGIYKNLVNEKVRTMKNWYAEILASFRKLISEASQDVWRCDPEVHEENTTYVQLDNVFQKFIINENNIKQSCDQTCDYDDVKQDEWCHAFNKHSTCRYTRRCDGKLHSCKDIFSTLNIAFSGSVGICQAPMYHSNRRYDIVSTSDVPWGTIKQTIGVKNQCSQNRNQSWEEMIKPSSNWFHSCKICLCTCDDNRGFYDLRSHQRLALTERFFYNKPILSNVHDNFVITGARLVKNQTVVYIQIQQGKLLEEGVIDPNSVKWTDVNEDDLYNHENHVELEWKRRSIELQDIKVPTGHVLVGLQIDGSSSDRLKLRVLSVPFDFKRGVISNPSAKPVPSDGNSISEGIDLEDSNLPPNELGSSQVLTNQYLKFSTSNFMSDLGQTTVPFLDIQNVETNVATPMEGAGLYYKHRPGYAGFIGIKLKSYDVSPYLTEYNDGKTVNFQVFSLEKGNIGIFEV